jgi:hypothetical protein
LAPKGAERSPSGPDSHRNLVSSWTECNSQEVEKHAGHFLRLLYRERRLTAAELAARLRALDALASGKSPPALARIEPRTDKIRA